MPEWDEKNRPKDYVVSVTPGFASYGQGEEKLINMGLARKIVKAARLGFEFAQIDFEALSEMFEPGIAKQVETIKQRQGLEVGLHLPVSMDLCLAHAYQWKQMHLQLKYGMIACAEKLQAKYGLFHTSSMARPAISAGVGERRPPTKMAAWNGINLGNWIEEVSEKGFDLKNWFMARFIEVMFRAMGVPGDPTVVTYFAEEVALEKKKGFKEGEQMARQEFQEMEDKIVNPAIDKINKEYEEKGRKINTLGDTRERLRRLLLEKEGLTRRIEQAKSAGANEAQLQGLRNQISEINDDINSIQENDGSMSEIEQEIHNLERRRAELRSGERHRQAQKDALMSKKWNGENAWDRYRQLQGVVNYLDRSNFDEIFRYWKTQGSECEERVAYHVVAKWMYKNKDPLYTSIVTEDKRDPDEVVHEANTKPHVKGSVPEAVKQIITAVASKYIEGHLTANDPEEHAIPVDKNGSYSPNTPKTEKISVLDYCKLHNVHIFIETNMPGGEEGAQGGGAPPGELRVIKATDHVKIVKNIDPITISYCMDFEHLLTNYVDPLDEAKELKKTGDGKYVRCIHTNAPRPVKGAHAPIMPISNDMYILYRFFYTMRQAGCKDAYIIWEMGSHGVKETAIAFRRIVEHLRKETDPEQLPKEFYGLDKKFEGMQKTAIREHAYDPLSGMLQIPEETHTFLSKASVDKGKAAEWSRERYR